MTASRPKNSAFTIVEMLVVITIVGIMMALLLPALNATVETARRAQCQHQLMQLITAVQNYEQAHEVYPPGTINPTGPIRNQPVGYHHSWVVQILPHLQQKVLYRHIDRSVGVYHKNNDGAAAVVVYEFVCPSDPPLALDQGCISYAAVHHDVEAPIDDDNHGVFFLNSRMGYDDIADGHAHTLFLGEKIQNEFPTGSLPKMVWLSGTRATLRNTGTPINLTGKFAPGLQQRWPDDPDIVEYDGMLVDEGRLEQLQTADGVTEADSPFDTNAADPAPPAVPTVLFVGGFASYHAAGANFAFGDGRTKFITENIDPPLYRQLGHRADGQPLTAYGN